MVIALTSEQSDIAPTRIISLFTRCPHFWQVSIENMDNINADPILMLRSFMIRQKASKVNLEKCNYRFNDI